MRCCFYHLMTTVRNKPQLNIPNQTVTLKHNGDACITNPCIPGSLPFDSCHNTYQAPSPSQCPLNLSSIIILLILSGKLLIHRQVNSVSHYPFLSQKRWCICTCLWATKFNAIFPWNCMYDRSIIAEWPYIPRNFTMAMIVWKKYDCMWCLPESVLYPNNSAQWWCLVSACSTLTTSSVTIKAMPWVSVGQAQCSVMGAWSPPWSLGCTVDDTISHCIQNSTFFNTFPFCLISEESFISQVMLPAIYTWSEIIDSMGGSVTDALFILHWVLYQ